MDFKSINRKNKTGKKKPGKKNMRYRQWFISHFIFICLRNVGKSFHFISFIPPRVAPDLLLPLAYSSPLLYFVKLCHVHALKGPPEPIKGLNCLHPTCEAAVVIAAPPISFPPIWQICAGCVTCSIVSAFAVIRLQMSMTDVSLKDG